MFDPSIMLLLTSNPSLVQATATTQASCTQPTRQVGGDRSAAQFNQCISPPEAVPEKPAKLLAAFPSKSQLTTEGGVAAQKPVILHTGYKQSIFGGWGDGAMGSSGDGESANNLFSLPPHLPTSPSNKSSDYDRAQYTPTLSPHKKLHAGLTFFNRNAQPQFFWLVGGVVLSSGGVAFFLRRKPSGNEGLGVERLNLAGVANNFQPANSQPSTRPRQPTRLKEFEQSVILQQSPIWLQLIVWGIVGVTTFTIIWACVAEIEEAIPAQGKLEPQGTVNNVQAPVGGVVKDIYVKEGQQVKAGDLLVSFDQTSAQAQLKSLQSIRAALLKENDVYRRQMHGDNSPTDIKLPKDLELLTQNRAAIVAENLLYQQQLQGGNTERLSFEQRQRLQSAQAELNSRVAAAKLVVHQVERQLNQNRIALADARRILAVNQEIFNGMAPLMKQGAIARVQILKQQQDVSSRQAEVDRLIQEQARLELEISRSKEQLQNTISASRETLFVKIDDNKKRLAEIDSQLTKAVVENEKRLAEIESQLSQTQQTLRYQDLRSPVDGTVFDVKANNPGFVANSSEPILKVVPKDSLIAKVFVTNQHIGFVKPGMQVDVRTDTFPYSEYGDIKGELVTIGSDALPPDSVYPFYRFPATIRLKRESILVNDRQVPLQSGMSVSANIKVRKRTVMSIFTSLFTQKIDAVKSVQ